MAISKCEIDEKSENEHLMLIGQSRTLKSIVQRNAIPMSNCQIIIWYKNVSIQNVGFILRTISSPLCRICTFVFSSNPPPIKTTPYLWFLLMESLIDVWIILSEISYQDVQFIPTYKDWKNTKHRCVKHQLLKPKRLKYFLEQLAILIG